MKTMMKDQKNVKNLDAKNVESLKLDGVVNVVNSLMIIN